MERILLVEDETALRVQLARTLAFHGYSVEAVEDGVPALAAHRARPADLIVLDLMLPEMDGFQVVSTLRGGGDLVPILMLTAWASESERVKGLSLGCDDYLAKPFSLLELFARIRAILRRTSRSASGPRALASGAFVLNAQSLAATLDGVPLDLTPREFRILELLVTHAGSTLSREEILMSAWPSDARPSMRTVDTHIKNLRKKLEHDGQDPIATVGGEGYRWTLAAPSARDLEGTEG
jgi:two-component system, OmpR family, response regulator MprA